MKTHSRILEFAFARKLALAWALAAALLHPHASVAAPIVATNWPVGVAIPDGDPLGLVVTRTFSSPQTNIADVNVTLTLANGRNGDLSATLRHTSGYVVLLNRVGRRAGALSGYDDPGMNVTFDDQATNDCCNVHTYRLTLNGSHTTPLGGPLTGSWQPDGRTNDPTVVLDTDLPATDLRAFNGLNPNGEWTLFLIDWEPVKETELVSWGLEVTGPASLPLPPRITNCPPDLVLTNCDGLVPVATNGLRVEALSGQALTITQDPIAGTPVGPGLYHITIRVCDGFGQCDECVVDLLVLAPERTEFRLFSGTDSSGGLLPGGAVDPNFIAVAGPFPNPPNVIVVSSIDPGWRANTADSKWVGPAANAQGNPGSFDVDVYHYRHEFTLACTNGARLAGRFAADNRGALYVNGQLRVETDNSTPEANFNSWTPMNVSGGFNPGLNTLDFYVTNYFGSVTGLRTELTMTSQCCTNCPRECLPLGTNVLAANDDHHTTNAVPLGFNHPICFGVGTTYSSLYVNNNGNVTFSGPFVTSASLPNFAPIALNDPLVPKPIIAPFWADVDTRAAGSAAVHYGPGSVGSRRAFFVSWPGVGYYDSWDDLLNCFNLTLIERDDVQPGAFDMVFSYGTIQWDEGDSTGGLGGLAPLGSVNSARAGYAASGTDFQEFPGSGQPGRLLDSDPVTGLIHGSLNASVPGCYVIPIRCAPCLAIHCTNLTVNTCTNGAFVNYPLPQVINNCGVPYSLNCTPPPGPFPLGVTEVCCTATPQFGPPVSCCFQVTVLGDTEAPQISCCGRPGPCGFPLPFGSGGTPCTVTVICGQPVCLAARATDNCGPLTIFNSLNGSATGSAGTTASVGITHTFPAPGTYLVTFTATDGAANSAQCSVTVIVQDLEAPRGPCPDGPPVIFTHGTVDDNFTGAEPAFPSRGLSNRLNIALKGYDECGTDSFFADTFTGLPSCITEARLRIRLRACAGEPDTDGIGLSFTDPVSGALQTERWGRGLVDLLGHWEENDVVDLVLDLSRLPNANGTFTDLLPQLCANGYLDIVVQDDTAVDYVILELKSCVCRADIIVGTDPDKCGAIVNYTLPVFTDNCDQIVVPVCVPPPGHCFPLGTTKVICTATDAAGNVGRCCFNVTVRDTTPPLLRCCAKAGPCLLPFVFDGPSGCAVIVNCGETVCLMAQATDNCGPVRIENDLNGQVNGPVTIAQQFFQATFSAQGVWTPVTFTATDGAGNESQCMVNVFVRPGSDLAITKTAAGPFMAGLDGTFHLAVRNLGCAAASAPVTVTDTLPGGLTPVSAAGNGWACSLAGQTVTCSYSGPAVPTGGDFPPIAVNAHIAANATAGPPLQNCAMVSSPNDSNPANNTSCVTLTLLTNKCFALTNETLVCRTNGGYLWSFTLVNRSDFPVSRLRFSMESPFGVTVTSNPFTFATPVPPGGQAPVSVVLQGPGCGEVCLLLSVHDLHDVNCCTPDVDIRKCLVLPECPCVDAPSGLVGWWTGDGTRGDRSGENNHGTLTNGATYGLGEVGLGFNLTASGAYVSVPDPANGSLDFGAGDFSIDAWIQTTTSGLHVLVDKRDSPGGNPRGYLLFLDGQSKLGFQLEDGAGFHGNYHASTGPALNDGQWWFVAATVDRGARVLTLYVNGQPVGTFTLPAALGGVSNGGELWLGNDHFTSSSFQGGLDEVEIFNRALAANEVHRLWTAGCAGKCKGPIGGPVIIDSPRDITVTDGSNVTFTVTAIGYPDLTYQWRTNGVPISNATNPTLHIEPVQPYDASRYDVVVTDGLGTSVISAPANLRVVGAPMGFRRNGPSLILEWPVDYCLQSTVTPADPLSWADVSGAISPYAVQLIGPANFFRTVRR